MGAILLIGNYYTKHSQQTHQEKINPMLCSGNTDLTEITAELLRNRDVQGRLALWMAVEEEVPAHSQELFPKLFAQDRFKQALNQKNRGSWAHRRVKSPWLELRHDQSSHSRANCSGITAQCLSALEIPSYVMDVSHNLSPRGHAADQCP